MKQVFFLIILILWSILQARRKAMREQKRKAEAQASASLGAVTSGDNDDVPVQQPIGAYSRQSQDIGDEADRFVREVREQIPENVRNLQKASRRAKKMAEPVLSPVQDDEVVDRLVTAPVVEDAYAQKVFVRRGISFDRQSMRTFFVTREVLGAPRSRKPFRPGLRGRE